MVLEKVVDTRIERHLVSNGLHKEIQAAYRSSHSTETALLKVQSDILEYLDNGCVTVLVMLDLSAAFDTLDHGIILHRFENSGISGAALGWIASYLHDRYQVVVIDGEHSDPVLLEQGLVTRSKEIHHVLKTTRSHYPSVWTVLSLLCG